MQTGIITALRAQIAALEHASGDRPAPPPLPFGLPVLDMCLPGRGLALGAVHELFGKGAGRWPSAASVFSDIMDVQRMLMAAGQAAGEAAPMPLRMSA